MSQVNLPHGFAAAAVFAPLGLGWITPVLLGLYLVAMRTVFAYERDHAAAQVEALDDLQPTLPSVSPIHAVTAATAITMTGLVLVGLFFWPTGRVLRALSWASLGLVAMYLLNNYVLFLYGD